MQVREAEGAVGSRGNAPPSFPLKDIQNLSAVIWLRFSNTPCTAFVLLKQKEKKGKKCNIFWSGVRKAGKHPLALANSSAVWPPAPLSFLQEDTADASEEKPAFQLYEDPQGKQALSQAE